MFYETGLSSLVIRWAALPRRVSALLSSTDGVAAVEFALILPLMLAMYLGMVVLTVGVSTDRKLTLMSRSVADLAGRDPSITDEDKDEIFGAATAVMQPYNGAAARITLSSVVVKATAGGAVEGRVCWSDARGATPRPENDLVAVPDGFRTAGTSFVLAEVEFDYVPVIAQNVIGTTVLKETTPWPVRNVREVSRNGKTCLAA